MEQGNDERPRVGLIALPPLMVPLDENGHPIGDVDKLLRRIQEVASEVIEEEFEAHEWEQVWQRFHERMRQKPEVQKLIQELINELEFLIQALNPRNLEFGLSTDQLGKIHQMLGSNQGISFLSMLQRFRSAYTLRKQGERSSGDGVFENTKATITRILRKTIEFFETTPTVDEDCFNDFYQQLLEDEEITHEELTSLFAQYAVRISQFLHKYKTLSEKELQESMPEELRSMIAYDALAANASFWSQFPVFIDVTSKILNML